MNKKITFVIAIVLSFVIFILPVCATGGDLVYDVSESLDAEAAYYPTSVVVFRKTGKLGVTWRNPTASSLEGISVLNAETGETAQYSVYSDDSFTLAPEGINRIVVNNLSETVSTKIKLLFKFSDHKNVEYICSAIANIADKTSLSSFPEKDFIDDWNLRYQRNSFDFIPARAFVDRNVNSGDDGSASVKFVANFDKHRSSTYIRLYQVMDEVEENKSYYVSVDVKYNNVRIGGDAFDLAASITQKTPYAGVAMNYNAIKFDSFYKTGDKTPNVNSNLSQSTNITLDVDADNKVLGSHDWIKREYIMNVKAGQGGKELRIQTSWPVEEFWVDNVVVKELDENGAPFGDNLVENGNFVIEDEDACDDVILSDESIILDGITNLKWTNPGDEDFKCTYIYEEVNGKQYEIAQLDSSVNSVKFTNSVDDSTKKFVIKTVDISDNLSDGGVCELTPQISSVILSDIAFEYGEEETNVVTAKISAKNNTNEFLKKGILCVVIYDNEGVLKDVVFSEVADLTMGSDVVDLKATFTLESGCSVQAFLIDDIINMNLIRDSSELPRINSIKSEEDAL